MPTLYQLAEWVKAEILKGKGALHTNHPVIMEEVQAERIANKPDAEGKRKTKIAWDCKDPDTFAEWHKEREKYFKAAGGNPVLATDAMIMALRIQDFEAVRRFVEALTEQESLRDA